MELYENINGREWCVSHDGTVSVCGKVICTAMGHVKMEDVRTGDALTAAKLLDKWREKCRAPKQVPEVYSPLWLNSNLNLPKHCNISNSVHTHGIGYILPDYSNPGAYYIFQQPAAFDGHCYPEPKWDGNYYFQTIKLPMPHGAKCIIDACPVRDEPNKVSIRWWNGKHCHCGNR